MKFAINSALQPVQNPVEIKHQNYLEYLSVCWANHYGAVVSPDILWHIVLCEIAAEVAKNPETYRSLFSTSEEKQEIRVPSSSPTELPLNLVVDALREKTNVPPDLFLPTFSTTGTMESLAFSAAFCDLVSPYYSYSMFCCGIPYVEVKGTPGDYHMAANVLDELSASFSVSPNLSDWLTSVADTFQDISLYLAGHLDGLKPLRIEEMANFGFDNFFSLKRCGSGSQVEVSGWVEGFFFNKPDLKFIRNYNTCVSKVKYEYLPTKQKFEMKVSLSESVLDGDLLVPSFVKIVEEINETNPS